MKTVSTFTRAICLTRTRDAYAAFAHASYILYTLITKFADIFTKVHFSFPVDDKTKWRAALSTIYNIFGLY